MTVRTVAGELFSILRPDGSDEMLQALTVLSREVLVKERRERQKDVTKL